MKNALTKTLMCGVLATTFFLINCQKAPNRGVKAKPGAAGAVDATGAAGKADAAKDTVACSADFAEKYKTSSELIKTIIKEASENLDDAMKESLVKKIDEANEKTKATIETIKKIKSTADSCSVVDPKTRATQIYRIDAIQKQLDDAAALVKTKTGKETTASKEADKRQKEKETQALANGLKQGLVLVVSVDLAKELVHANRGDVLAISEGKIGKLTDAVSKIKKERSKTICQLADMPDKVEIKANDELKVTSYQLKDSKKEVAEYVLMSGDTAIRLECTLAKGKETSFASEFRKALGEHLKAKDAVAAKPASEVSEAEKKRTADQDAAKKDYEAKDTAYNEAFKKVEESKEKITKIKADLEKAKTDKKTDLVKELQKSVDLESENLKKLEASFEAAKIEREKSLKVYEAFFPTEI